MIENEALAEAIARRLADYLLPEIRRPTSALLNGLAQTATTFDDMIRCEKVCEDYKNGGDGERK